MAKSLKAKIARLLFIIIAGPIIALLIPALLISLIPTLLYQTVVRIIAKLFRPDLGAIYSGNKGVFFALESVHTRPKLNVVVGGIVEGTVPIEKIRQQMEQRILNQCDKHGNYRYSRLRQTWTEFLGFIFWKWDKNFDVNHHVRVYDYTEPKLRLPEVCSEDDLRRVMTNLISQPYTEGRSPWELLFVPKYHPAGNVEGGKEHMAWIMRGHHALGDGYSVLKMVFDLFDLENVKIPMPTLPKLTAWLIFKRLVVLPFRLPFDLATQAIDALDFKNPWHLVGQKLSREFVTFHSDPVSVEKIKQVKNKYKVGYNTVAYAVAIGGIRRLMEEAGQKIPREMSCLVPFPLPGHPGGLVVHVTACVFKFSPREASPVKRLYEISNDFYRLQDAPVTPFALSWISDLVSLYPVWILRLIYNKAMFTMAMTCFPGPEHPVEALGAKQVDIMLAVGPNAGNVGAVGSLISFAGSQRITLTVHREIFDSYKVPTRFAQHVNDEIHELLAHANKI